jgi:hypothetical protein
VSAPITARVRLPAAEPGIFDEQATGLPDWDGAEAAGWNSAEGADWDLGDLAGWEPEGPAEGPPEPAVPDPAWDAEAWEPEAWDPEAWDPEAERHGVGCAEGRRQEALQAGPLRPAGGDGGWFAAGGVADGLPPGPRLAEFMTDARAIGLGRLTDDELIGLMRAARRLASWSAAIELAAAGDLWRRRWADDRAGDAGAACHADDEIAAALTLTRRAADQVLSLAVALRRLPLTSRALSAGDIDLPRAMVIADEVTGLDNDHAAAVERVIIGAAAGQTTGQLRAAARRAVLSADPRVARKRKERALLDARVERWDEHGGTAALAGRDLPPASVLAADQNLSALARQLKGAGAPGTLDQLRAQVYLAVLTGTPMSSLIPATPGIAGTSATPGLADPPGTSANPGSPGAPASPGVSASPGAPASPGVSASPGAPGTPAPSAPGAPGTSASPRFPGTFASPRFPGTFASPGSPGASGAPASPGSPGTGGAPGVSDTPGTSAPFFASGTVNLTMPLASWLGLSDAPGTVAGYGPMDAEDSRTIADVLSARSDTRWCLTLTDSHGRPVAHGCARAAPPPPPPLRRAEWLTRPSGALRTGCRDGPADSPRDGPADSPRDGRRSGAPSGPEARASGRTWTFSLTVLAGGDCDHSSETAAYRPSPGLRHLVEIRHVTCTYPGCRRPAARCDADHTVAYHRGGRTCLCNLAPLCRHHHEVKQSPGWRLDQVSPGVMTWTTPAGRHYAVVPSDYPE